MAAPLTEVEELKRNAKLVSDLARQLPGLERRRSCRPSSSSFSAGSRSGRCTARLLAAFESIRQEICALHEELRNRTTERT
jgi:hypothetical protein